MLAEKCEPLKGPDREHRSRADLTYRNGLGWTVFVIVSLLRRWGAARTAGERVLTRLVQAANDLGETSEAAISLHSVFQLTESCLGRSLEVKCCCSRSLTADEGAILSLVFLAPASGPEFSSSQVPHGLPGVLWWAAASARVALGIVSEPAEDPLSRCPFERPGTCGSFAQ
jgi:hypothetical protein